MKVIKSKFELLNTSADFHIRRFDHVFNEKALNRCKKEVEVFHLYRKALQSGTCCLVGTILVDAPCAGVSKQLIRSIRQLVEDLSNFTIVSLVQNISDIPSD